MLLRKQSEWDGRVRIVAVNKAGKTPSNIEDEDHKPVDWTLIEHLEL
jgi:hypothetical protein